MLLQGTLDYLAPEVLAEWMAKSKGETPVPVKPSQADMWSVGCLLLEALTGKNPFKVTSCLPRPTLPGIIILSMLHF